MLYQIYKYKYARQGLCSKGQFAYQKIARGSLCWPRTETGLCRFIIIIMTIITIIIIIIIAIILINDNSLCWARTGGTEMILCVS